MTTEFNYKTGFLSRAVFTPYADLDGESAAEWLKSQGVEMVTFKDHGTNGLAEGFINGQWITLSTNGYLSVGE